MWSLVFPGQGSQSPGMGRYLYDNFKVAKETFEEASDHLHIDFKKLCFEGPEDQLNLTENTQPSLLLVSIATFRSLATMVDLKPQAAAGHSIGEYAAVVAADALGFKEALQSVRSRGQAMQAAVPLGEGGMTAVLGLEPEQIEIICSWAVRQSGGGPISPANFNAPGQIVISGAMDTLTWLGKNVSEAPFAEKPRRLKLIPLAVSAPFHCELMKPAEEKMAEVLGQCHFTEARFPVIQNFNAKAVTAPKELRSNLVAQVSAPVRWTECAEVLKQKQATQCIECGSGKVIAGLMKKIDSESFTTFNTNSLDELKQIETEFSKGS